MEGDAGASQLNPTDADDSLPSEAITEDSPEPGVEAEENATGDSSKSDAEVGAVQVGGDRGPSRLGHKWLAGIGAAFFLIAGVVGSGGYFALRAHQESQVLARNDAAALQAAKGCVSATQAPDTNAMVASEQKIIDCGTDQFRSQALLYTSMLIQAYQAANVHVQVSDMRAAVERNHNDGSVDVLLALRVKVLSGQTQDQETGYRLRVKMAFAGGQYRIAKLDQVTK